MVKRKRGMIGENLMELFALLVLVAVLAYLIERIERKGNDEFSPRHIVISQVQNDLEILRQGKTATPSILVQRIFEGMKKGGLSFQEIGIPLFDLCDFLRSREDFERVPVCSFMAPDSPKDKRPAWQKENRRVYL